MSFRSHVEGSGIHLSASSSRKRYSFVQTGTSDIECGVEFLDHLTRQCQCEVFAVRATIAKFLFALLASKTAISSRDSIIQANAGVLSSWFVLL